MVHNGGMEYTVKQLAKLAGVSVRTLHYYDQVGLLKPSYLKPNGYRCYEEAELIKLQQILFFRELDFSLGQITAIFEAPGFDAAEALADQRKLLEMERARLDRLLATIDATLKSLKGEAAVTTSEMYGAFNKKQLEEMKMEVREKWGPEKLEELSRSSIDPPEAAVVVSVELPVVFRRSCMRQMVSAASDPQCGRQSAIIPGGQPMLAIHQSSPSAREQVKAVLRGRVEE